MQFYLLFVFLLYLGDRLRPIKARRAVNPLSLAIMSALALLSTAILGHWLDRLDGWFVNEWGLFFLGSVTWWWIDERVSQVLVIGYAVCLIVAAAHAADATTTVALLTVGSIATLAKTGRLTTAMGQWPFQFFGRISYGLYLTHALVGFHFLDIVSRRAHTSVPAAIVCLAAAIVLSVTSAWLMHRYVEQPGIRLGKRLKMRHEYAQAARRCRRVPATLISTTEASVHEERPSSIRA